MNNTLKLVAMASVAFLTACGGGGSGGSSTPAPAPTPPVSTASSLITTVGPATYTGELAIAFNLINAERSRCAFGLLSQNAQLDTAAAAHARYVVTNSSAANFHVEVAGQPGFTGATVTDRVKAAGYNAGSVTEVGALGKGGNAVRILLSAPYHLAALMRSYRDIGIGMQDTTSAEFPVFNADLGYQTVAAPQLLSSTDVSTYPCAGTTDVKPALFGESPNPVPGRDLATNPIGSPIYVAVRDGNSLAITSAAMIKLSNGASVPLRAAVTAANDPHKMLASHQGFVAPDVALDPNSQYQVTVTGTNNGVAFSRTFPFNTGNTF